jgi:hypothetical protein
MNPPRRPGRGVSRAWSLFWRLGYAWLRLTDPLIRAAWRSGGMGITVDLAIRGRRTERERRVLVGLIQVDGRWYVGHPNGEAAWTRNLASARSAAVTWPGLPSLVVRAERLPDGAERDTAIVATASQQPFPGNLIYRAARRHVLAAGVYFRLDPESNAPD